MNPLPSCRPTLQELYGVVTPPAGPASQDQFFISKDELPSLATLPAPESNLRVISIT